MKLRNIVMLIVVLTTGFTSLFAQNSNQGFSCGHAEMQQKLWDNNPDAYKEYETILKNLDKFETEVDKKRGTKKYIIPIVFHILHENGSENISDQQVKNQVEILNLDFNKLNADTMDVQSEFKNIIANCNFEFRLATKDPKGNCTNGINHYYTHLTNNASDNSKINQWNRAKYLNIWVVKTIGKSGVAGYAYFPNSAVGPFFKGDGVIILHNYIGSIGTSNAYRSRALTHEIGHYLGLAHVWGNSNDPEVSCGDDGITDTPKTKGHSSCVKSSLNNTKQTCITGLSFLYSMDSVKVNSGAIDPTPLSKMDSATFSALKAVGLSSKSNTSKLFEFTNWGTGGVNKDTTLSNQTGALDAEKYYEFSVTPKKNGLLTIDQIKFKTYRDSNGVKSFAVRSSIDNFATNLSLSTSNTQITRIVGNAGYIKNDTARWFLSTIKTPSKDFQDLTTNEKVTFRIYGWNAEKTNGSFGIDSLVVIGKTGAIENIENYMEYSYCSYMFTNEQAKLMRLNLESDLSSRNNLWSEANLIATGVSDVSTAVKCTPKANFRMTLKKDNQNGTSNICAGTSVIFHDISENATVISRKWLFENGTPATSTDANPEVTFDKAGGNNVTLIVSNEQGSDTLSINNSVFVTNFSSESGYLTENFEKGYSWDWKVEDKNENSSSFAFSTKNGKNKSGCLKLNNYRDLSKYQSYQDEYYYYDRLAGTKHAIITPAINLSTTTNVSISFDYAFATDAYYDSLITDQLNVFVSKDCGENWSLKKSIAGPKASTSVITVNTLLTAGNSSGSEFSPESDVLWKNITIPLTVNSADTKTRIKFEFIPSKYANNFYIDNVNINGVLQIEESPITKMNLNVYPNPTNENENISISYQANNENVTFEIIDVQGKVLTREINTTKNTTVNHTFNNPKLTSGCYFVKASQGEFTSTFKVVVL